MQMSNLKKFSFLSVALASFAIAYGAPVKTTVQVQISGGHETKPVDRGRPVILVASALGVREQVFREAFSHVRPAPAGQEPEREQVDRNKQALLDALSRYGVTNNRLDEVSNYYRYRPGSGELWPIQPARILVTLLGARVAKVQVLVRGAGYSSLPTLRVPGHPEIRLVPKLAFGPDFDSNGSIGSISVVDAIRTKK